MHHNINKFLCIYDTLNYRSILYATQSLSIKQILRSCSNKCKPWQCNTSYTLQSSIQFLQQLLSSVCMKHCCLSLQVYIPKLKTFGCNGTQDCSRMTNMYIGVLTNWFIQNFIVVYKCQRNWLIILLVWLQQISHHSQPSVIN